MPLAPAKTLIAALLLTAWMGAFAAIMILARTINIEIFFVLRLIGFLIITEFFVVTTLRPKSARWFGCALRLLIKVTPQASA
jgi:ABC-type uncharacterized transport system permease subunit